MQPLNENKLLEFLAQLTELFILAAKSAVCVFVDVCMCLDVNQGGRNCNRCTQRLVILHAQAY